MQPLRSRGPKHRRGYEAHGVDVCELRSNQVDAALLDERNAEQCLVGARENPSHPEQRLVIDLDVDRVVRQHLRTYARPWRDDVKPALSRPAPCNQRRLLLGSTTLLPSTTCS